MKAYKQEGAYGSYLIFILHHVNQTGFIVMTGIQSVQIAGMDVLGIQSSVSHQINIPLAFAKGSKFFLGSMFGQSDGIAWLCMANASNDNLIILGTAGLHWSCWLVSRFCWTGGAFNPDGTCGLMDRT